MRWVFRTIILLILTPIAIPMWVLHKIGMGLVDAFRWVMEGMPKDD